MKKEIRLCLYVYVALAMTPIVAGACAGRHSSTASSDAVTASGKHVENRELELPQPPDSLTTPNERLGFLTLHYWDNMPWENTEACRDTAFVEQSVVNYLDLLAHADSLTASNAYRHFLSIVPAKHRAAFSEVTERYLYDPESPMYNGELYMIVLEANLARRDLGNTERVRLTERRKELMKNRRGTKAADFDIVLAEGTRTRLSRLVSRTPECIVIFYDPECDACHAEIKRLRADESINRHISNGTLQVIAVEPFDSDQSVWAADAKTMPSNWTIGRAPGLDASDAYLFRSSPTIYILRSDLTVKGQDVRI